MNQRPVVVGLFLCEQVIIEAKTRNFTPVNCFNVRAAGSFPTDALSLTALAVLTDGHGDVDLGLCLQRLDTLEIMVERTFRVKIDDPLVEAPFVFRIKKSFPSPGEYQAVLFANEEMLAHKRFTLQEK